MMPLQTPLIGLDVGSRWIKAAQHRAGGVVTGTLARRGETIDWASIADMLEQGGFRGRRVVLALPPERTTTVRCDLPPPDSGAPIGKIARLQAAEAAGVSPASLQCAWWHVPKGRRAGAIPSAAIHAVPGAVVEGWVSEADACGVTIEAVDLRPFAVARLVSASSPAPDGVVAVADLGWSATRILLLCDGVPVYERADSEAGFARLVETFGASCGVPVRQAERWIARGAVPESLRAGYERVLARFMDRAIKSVRTATAYATHVYPERTVCPVRVLGGGAVLGFRDVLRERGIDAEDLEPVWEAASGRFVPCGVASGLTGWRAA